MINFSDIEDAFFFVGSESYGLHTAILNTETGVLYYRSEISDLDEIDELLDWEQCVSIPHKNELGLGRELVFEFIETNLPDDDERIRQIFRKRGAYGNFKYLLESKGLLQRWFDFENQQTKEVFRKWCQENGIAIAE
ncbi:MAG: hypothetical protein L6461_24020 [Anaerolineae bacterium]|nr:hypothetical protein [Anaerolineae bacterium]